MRLRAILVLFAAIAFAVSPFLVPGFGGYDPSQFPVPIEEPPVQPAGYAFSIWGVIYLWLVAMAVYGLLRRAEDATWDATRPPLLVSLAVGAVWLVVAIASPIWATVLIWIMLAGALVALLRAPRRDRLWLRGAIGLYAGWLTAASAVSLGLLAAGWGLEPLSPEGWAVAALTVGLVIAVLILLRAPSPTYGGAVVWALIAVTVQNGANGVGIFAAVAAVAVFAFTVVRARREAVRA